METKPAYSQPLQLILQLVTGDELHEEDIDRMTRSLRSELEELPYAEHVRLGTREGQVPAGAKAGAEVIALGALAMAILPNAAEPFLSFLGEWISRPGNRPLKLKWQHGERSAEVEFDPRTISEDKVKRLLSEIQALVDRRND